MCDPDPDRDLAELLADIERIRRALDAEPDSADLHARLAESLHELAFEPTWDDHPTPHIAGSGDRDPLLLAAMHLSRACGLRPGDVELRRQMADVLHDLHAYDLMSTELSRALRSQPDDPELLISLAHALAHNPGTRPRAMEALRRAQELAPDSEEVLRAIAYGIFNMDAPEESLRASERLLTQVADTEERATLLAATAEAHARLGRMNAALDALAEAAALRPGECHDHRRGELLQEAGRLEEAVAAYLAEAEADPEDGGARRSAAQVLAVLGRPDEAEHWFRAALQADPECCVESEWGQALLEAGRVSEALPHLRAALVRAPRDTGTRRVLARALEEAGRLDDAAYELGQADALDANGS